MTLKAPIGSADLDERPAPPRDRILVLGAEGQVTRMAPIQARDDPHAGRMAQMFVDGHAVELWNGVRFMEHFSPVD